ncbi:MAG: hypothetical protein E6792_09965, partial [Streptococcus thermophilus]|nr:hypothetical protein [Streptococcus thermophilus]
CALASFHPCETLSEEFTSRCKGCIFMESRTQKARMQTHTGLFKTGDGVRLTQRPPLAQAGFAFRAAFTTAREAAVRFFLNPHGFAHAFQLLQHGVNHWLRRVQCLAYLGRFHTAP